MASPLRTKPSPASMPESRPFLEPGIIQPILNGLSVALFFVSCLLLPLVGRAAALTAWYRSNVLIYAGILMGGLAVSLAALFAAKKSQPSPVRLPRWMVGVFVVMLVLLAMGRFKA